MDIAHGELVEKELDILIERRSRKGEVDPDELEPSYAESVRRYNGCLEVEAEYACLAWAKHLRGVYAARKGEYERLVEMLEGTQRKETP